MKHLFLIHHLAGENLLIKMVSPGWMLYGILLIGMTPLTLFGLNPACWKGSLKQDWTPISLPSEGVYGYCRQDRIHPEGVRFLFDADESEWYDLVFSAGSNGSGADLAISLNGQNLPSGLLLPSGWRKETSLRLPSTMIHTGSNQIEFRVRPYSSEAIRWGIRKVRIVPNENSSTKAIDHTFTIDKILSLLQSKDLQGFELARYYRVVDGILRDDPTERFANELIIVKKQIETRMEMVIRDTLIQLRAARIMGNEAKSNQIIHDTRLWIPENWTKGLEILDGFDFR